MTPEIIIDTPEGPPDLPRNGTRQLNTLRTLANVPVSVSEEEGTQMESEDEEKDSKPATDPTIEGKVSKPATDPTIEGKVHDMEDMDDKEDNDNNSNDKDDDDDDDGDKEEEDNDDKEDDDEGDDDNEEYTDDDEEERIFDFDLNDIEGMSEYELLCLWNVHRNNAILLALVCSLKS
jgi:hypothetical protein